MPIPATPLSRPRVYRRDRDITRRISTDFEVD